MTGKALRCEHDTTTSEDDRMKTARELRDDFLAAIKDAIRDEDVVTPATSVKKEGGSALVVAYDNGKRFRVTVEELPANVKI
jgi:hypothetical protein